MQVAPCSYVLALFKNKKINKLSDFLELYIQNSVRYLTVLLYLGSEMNSHISEAKYVVATFVTLPARRLILLPLKTPTPLFTQVMQHLKDKS